jgi:hypothetical protein
MSESAAILFTPAPVHFVRDIFRAGLLRALEAAGDFFLDESGLD